jgi:CheY-like chemotaxis protein
MTKIMLVEDDKSLREIYGVRLLAEGYDIISAGDGEEALAMAIKDRPQLIISDVMMPKISGFDMLDILRSTTETKNIRVIMMTALSSDEQRARGEQLGADKYLVKSQVGIEDVVKAVHDVLQDAPGAANQPAPPPAAATAPTPQAQPQTPSTAPPPVAGSQSVTDTPTTTIPEPTAPFTGERPASLGERVIQPLPDNPRVSNVDVGELMDQEFASTVQSVENIPVAQANPPQPMSRPEEPVPSTTSMEPPAVPQPAQDEAIAVPIPEPANPTGMQYEETPSQPVAPPAAQATEPHTPPPVTAPERPPVQPPVA